MSKQYSQEQIIFLEVYSQGKTCREVTDAFNYRFGVNKSIQTIRGVLRGRMLDAFIVKEPRYTDAQLTFLFVNKESTYTALTDMFNQRFGTKKTVDAIKATILGKGWGKYQRSGKCERQRIYINGKPVRLDIYVWECVNGPLSPGYTVIHLDNDEKNNQIANLRAAPVRAKAMFYRAGGAEASKALAPALYARVMLESHINHLVSPRPSRRRTA